MGHSFRNNLFFQCEALTLFTIPRRIWLKSPVLLKTFSMSINEINILIVQDRK